MTIKDEVKKLLICGAFPVYAGQVRGPVGPGGRRPVGERLQEHPTHRQRGGACQGGKVQMALPEKKVRFNLAADAQVEFDVNFNLTWDYIGDEVQVVAGSKTAFPQFAQAGAWAQGGKGAGMGYGGRGMMPRGMPQGAGAGAGQAPAAGQAAAPAGQDAAAGGGFGTPSGVPTALVNVTEAIITKAQPPASDVTARATASTRPPTEGRKAGRKAGGKAREEGHLVASCDRPRSDLQRDDLGRGRARVDRQCGERDRKLEPPRTGAAGVQVQDPALGADRGPVRMSADHHVEAGRRGVQVQPPQVVQDVEDLIFELDHLGFRQRGRPGPSIDVPPHGNHRGQLAEGRQDVVAAHVARMEDQVRPAASAATACGRSSPCVSEMTPTVRNSFPFPRHAGNSILRDSRKFSPGRVVPEKTLLAQAGC